MNRVWIVSVGVVGAAAAAWSARSVAIDAYMARDFVVTNSTTQARKVCVDTNDAEACAYADAPGFTRLRYMCATTLDGVVFSQVCPVGMIEGRDIETDRAFDAKKRL